MRGEPGGVCPGHNIPITGVAGCCARAPTGKVAAVLARPAMKSRRLMGGAVHDLNNGIAIGDL